jgi:hypothetical protein
MKRLILQTCGAMAVSALLSACGNSPKSTVEAFYNNVEKGELSEAKKVLSSQLFTFLGEQKLTAGLAGETEHIGKCGGIKSVKPELQTQGEVAVGTTTVEYKGDCKPRVEKTKLVKENGVWKLTASK